MYKLAQNGVIRLSDMTEIPNNPANRDWQEYQEWLKKGNTPIPEHIPESCIDFNTFVFDETCVFQKIKEQKIQELLSLEKQRLQKFLDDYGYISLADVQFYVSQNDQEAQSLLAWYSEYDKLIWSYIDNDLQAFTSVDELLQIDMKNIEQQIYEQSIQASPLP